ncbi:hypothetical protein L2E82_11547 [Cichorium intybus]|uniref:Uncharacterized protein n=1 Tax=Cichorium intybus TaxID=13427 RepID=A0ACB9GDM1_CICIN|nr:hypothetical protein L2E82_11547 [Cichorium intybus]
MSSEIEGECEEKRDRMAKEDQPFAVVQTSHRKKRRVVRCDRKCLVVAVETFLDWVLLVTAVNDAYENWRRQHRSEVLCRSMQP